jgi:hypothetical protein
VIFLAGKPDPVRISEFAADGSLQMVSRVIGHHVYVDYVDGVHGNPRTAAYFERVLRVQGHGAQLAHRASPPKDVARTRSVMRFRGQPAACEGWR